MFDGYFVGATSSKVREQINSNRAGSMRSGPHDKWRLTVCPARPGSVSGIQMDLGSIAEGDRANSANLRLGASQSGASGYHYKI